MPVLADLFLCFDKRGGCSFDYPKNNPGNYPGLTDIHVLRLRLARCRH